MPFHETFVSNIAISQFPTVSDQKIVDILAEASSLENARILLRQEANHPPSMLSTLSPDPEPSPTTERTGTPSPLPLPIKPVSH